ncbi:hypothetical protein BGX27_008934 [Mortierella sp. AM989]|nr:hypothetical protein BGX27_008934 [Mortierella sp. AM989]
MATTSENPSSGSSAAAVSSRPQSTSTATVSGSELSLGDSHHIFTVAARSLYDCAEILRFLKAAIAEEEQENENENKEQELGNISGRNDPTNGHPSDHGINDAIHHDDKRRCNDDHIDRCNSHETSTISAFVPTASGLRMVEPCKRSEIYTKPSALACQGTIGKHVRHLHDHFRLLLSTYPPCKGLSLDHEWLVDYDQRSREVPMETDIDVAIRELERIQFMLEKSQLSQQESIPSGLSQAVTLQATIDPSYPPVSFQSTFGRELWFCSLHACWL